ncbi:MAG TPA: BTAD domain-containing putative transcriptional regulator [Thermodesulfobacteriota bacterium]|nr:BTAD domain-containing putative transcriptional regulator [Thermodesulfobacteriota bacterium]
MGNVTTTEDVPLAKITHPGATGLFPRKRLFRLLDQGRKNPIVLVYGPPGSGKTSLVASYLDARQLSCLWYRIDEGDADLATFFYYMGIGARKATPRKRKPLPLFTPEYLQGISTFTLRYFENLLSRFKAPYILVFDNFHCVPVGSQFHEVIGDGLSTIPDGINVILISRHDLPPALTKLHANSKIGMLGWDELRLNLEETGGIVPLRAQGVRSKDVIRRLHLAADGWVAGLVLILEGFKRGIEPHLLGRLTPEEILKYFGSELFDKTDKETQDFFLKTAFLPRMTAKMAEELTGFPNAGSILSTLSRNNNFTQKHYSEGPVYQYHQLFREFLLVRAKETYSSAVLSDLRHRAAFLLEEAGQIEDAAILFRDAGDWEAMIQLITKQAPLMISQGRYRPFEEWLDSLPNDLVENDPWLLYWKGTSRSPFDPALAQPYFEQAFEKFRVQGNLPGALLAWSGVVYSIVYRFEHYSPLDRWIQLFPELPENPEKVIPPEVWTHVVSSMFIASTYRHPGHSETEKWIKRAESIVQGPSVPVVKAQILLQLVHWYMMMGDFEQSSINVRLLQHLTQSKDALPFVIIMTRLAEAMHYGFTGDHERCLEAVFEGVKTSGRTGILLLNYILLAHGVSSYQNLGDHEAAQSMLEKIASSTDHFRPYEKGLYQFVQARQFLLRSELSAAATQVELALRTNVDIGTYDPICLTYLLAAQVIHRTGKQQEAWDYLHEAFLIAESVKSNGLKYHGFMIEAHFYFEQGDEVSGLASLRKALAIGKEQGFLNTFVDQPAVTARLCVKALEEEIEVPYVQEIIRKRRLIPEKPPLHLENWPWYLKVFTLGRFELLRENKPIPSSRKIQQKPLAMLKVLIALGGIGVKEDQLSDILWPEADGDDAHNSFITTQHRLRQLIGHEGVIQHKEGRLTLDEGHCWVDVWAFERLLGHAESENKKGSSENAAHCIEKAIGLYKGPFLADEAEQSWMISLRERLRTRFMRSLIWLGRYWQGQEEWEKAIESYQEGVAIDEAAEDFYQRLMICYRELGRRAEALSVYERCRKTLHRIFGIDPSLKTEAIYKTLNSDAKK